MQQFNDVRFQVSETQALLDLFNKANRTNFLMEEFTVSDSSLIVSDIVATEQEPNTISNVVLQRNDVIVFDSTITHHRLNVAIRIPTSLRYLWDGGDGAIGALAAIRTRLRIQFTDQYTDITTVDTSDGKSFYRVSMNSDNPSWTGVVLFEKVTQVEEQARDLEQNFTPGDPLPIESVS